LEHPVYMVGGYPTRRDVFVALHDIQFTYVVSTINTL